MARASRRSGGLRVLIVEDDARVGAAMGAQVEKLGHAVAGVAETAAQAKELFAAEEPDLILLDIQLDTADGIELARELAALRRVPTIVVTAYGDRSLIERAAAAGVFGYLLKPVTDKALEAQVEMALDRFAEQEELRAQNETLAGHLETRKLMERAKGVLMKRAGLGEEEAHRRLQQESQKRRIGMAELCRRIIDSDDLLGD